MKAFLKHFVFKWKYIPVFLLFIFFVGDGIYTYIQPIESTSIGIQETALFVIQQEDKTSIWNSQTSMSQAIETGWKTIFLSSQEIVVFPGPSVSSSLLYIVTPKQIETKYIDALPIDIEAIKQNKKETYLLLYGRDKETGKNKVCLTDKLVINFGCIRLPEDVIADAVEQEDTKIGWLSGTPQDIAIRYNEQYYRFHPWEENALSSSSSLEIKDSSQVPCLFKRSIFRFLSIVYIEGYGIFVIPRDTEIIPVDENFFVLLQKNKLRLFDGETRDQFTVFETIGDSLDIQTCYTPG